MCVASHTGLGDDSCNEATVVNINTFYPLDRMSTMVEVFSSNPQVLTIVMFIIVDLPVLSPGDQ